jgi:ribosome maturation factor RimP
MSENHQDQPNLENKIEEKIEPRYIGGAMLPGLIEARKAIEPIVHQAGLTFIGIEKAQEGRRPVLWVYLDHPDGITVDQCGDVSPEISAVLDVHDPIDEAYDLRVSSPGLDRPLMSDAHFQENIGKEVQIKLMSPLQGRRNFVGIIEKLDLDLQIKSTDGVFQIPLELIQRARLRYDEEELKALLKGNM